MPAYPSNKLVDSFEFLPNADAEHFVLSDHTFAFPTFDNAEELVEKMIAADLLYADPVVFAAVTGNPKAMSERSTQRHFVQSTGLTQKYLAQIQRAQEAVRQLQQGKSPAMLPQTPATPTSPTSPDHSRKLWPPSPQALTIFISFRLSVLYKTNGLKLG